MTLTLNEKPATKITAERIKQSEKAIYLDCEGDYEWFPKQYIKYNHEEKTVVIEDWLYNKKFNL